MPYLRPDGKCQVTIEYDENNKPVRIDNILVSNQHEDVFSSTEEMQSRIKNDIINKNIKSVLKDLGIKTIKEDKYGYNFIKKLFLLKVNSDKFEDVEVNADNLIMLNECCKCYKLPYEQISLF